METDDTMPKLKSSSRDWQSIILQFTEDPYWKVFILFTIILNVLITINCFPYSENEYFIYLAVIVHLTCLFYWIDFCFAIALRCRNYGGLKERSMELLMADAISLVPLSLIYLLVVYNVNITVFWIMRCNTLIRFYRIHEFLGTIKIVDRSHWKTLVGTYAFYTFILIDIFANYWVLQVPYSYDIYQWNATSTNHFIICFYFSVVTGLNVGFGDIAPTNEVQILFCCLMMTAGFILTTGVITGAMTTGFANKEKKREIYRIEYESTMTALRQEKIDKHVLDKISDNLLTSWRHRKGLSQAAFSDVLPLSMQKEIYFDVNFGFLNRSLVFSLQPRSFLRSVSLMMRNMSFFPGDIILHPFGISEMMLCVASGVIEVLSEENDDTPLLSFTTGTIIGEASLFFSIPIKCIIRAATHVELQVLMKLSVTQMALKYPEIYRAMRADTFYRIRFIEGEANRDLDPDVNEISRRKATKRFIRELKSANRNNTKDEQNTHRNWFKSTLLQLYVLSENIPRTKTLPINLIKSKPWILRPDTPLIKLWDGFIVLVVTVVSFSYPYWMAFERKISLQMYVMLFLVEVVYITDLYIQCTTAIETNDHFTYIVSIKQIITHKLKTIGFYLDVLATYDFTIYTEFLTPDDQDYGYLLLSLNRILKFWHIPRYFSRLEDNVSLNLFTLRTIKYFFYYSIMVFWSGALLYFEACPGEVCVMERWYARLELNEVNQSIGNPRSQWPSVVSLYWGSVIISAEGYGDLVPKAIPDVWAVLVCIFVGAVIVTYCTAQASATMKHFVRHRTRYQEEVFAVNRFMSDHEIPKELQSKVRQYFRVQWNFDKAFSMKHHQQIHEMPAQQRDIILALLVKKLLTVPVFQNMDNNFLRLIAKSCKKRVLPPNEPVVFSGSYARELYILEQGYCEVTTDDNQRTVIGPLSPFGYVEMITGTPLEINVSTLTHACVVSLDYASYLRAVTQYPTIKTQIDSAIGDMVKSTLRKGQPLDILNLNPFPPETKSPNERALLESYLSKDFINVYKYHKALSTNYWEPFREWGKYRFFQFLLLPVVLSPSSLFLKIWAGLRIINVLIISFTVPIYFSLPNMAPYLRTTIYTQEIFSALDIYLMFHVAYYDRRGLLMFHPAKTATWYLKNTFLLDLVTTFPFYLVAEILYPSPQSFPRIIQDAPGFIMVLQFYKFFQACYYLENDILRPLPHLKTLKFVPMSLVFTNILTGFLILIECHVSNEQYHGSITNLQTEFEEGVKLFCLPNNTYKTNNLTSPFRFYLITYYWITTTMTTCGFGDVVPHNSTSMILVIMVIIFGLFLYGYMFASLTSTMISAYNSVAKYRRRMHEMSHFMKHMNADSDIQNRLILHYEYNWQRTEETSPQKMFQYINPALREAIVSRMYENTIRQVPVFVDVEKVILRVIGKYSEEIYFLGGETIVKYNDIQEYIYIIYRGKVEVVSPNGRRKATMGSGGLFGNITEKPFSLSPHSVVAIKNVDILRLNSRVFFKTLKTIPNTKHLIEFLNSNTKGYITPLDDRNEDSMLLVAASDALRVTESLSHEVMAMRRTVYTSEINLSPLKINFYLKNSIFIPPDKNLMKIVFLHDSWLYSAIELSVFIAAYLSCTLTFYMFCFQDFSLWLIVVSYILDAIFLFKILVQFNLSYFDKYGNYVISKRRIKRRYFSERKSLGFDIAANLPLEILALAFGHRTLLVLSILRLNRVVRVYYIYQLYDIKRKVLMLNKINLQLSWILSNGFLLIHFFACCWYFISCPFGTKINPSWVTQMNLQNASNAELFIYSVYYIITLTTTTGYGQVSIISTIELIVSTILMIVCRFGVALLAGSMAAVISVHGLNLFIYVELISDLKEDLIRQHLSVYQMSKMWHYVTSLWLEAYKKKIPKFIESAPYVMRCDVMYSMFGNHLLHCYLFANMDETFLKQLAIHLKRFIYFPGNYIVQQGDIDHTMYFIQKGQVSVLTIQPSLTETIHCKLQENDQFGLKQGLIMESPHRFSYRAETKVEMLSLTLHHWQILLKYFPEIGQNIYQRLVTLPQHIEESRLNPPPLQH